jgi:hypothetical protein
MSIFIICKFDYVKIIHIQILYTRNKLLLLKKFQLTIIHGEAYKKNKINMEIRLLLIKNLNQLLYKKKLLMKNFNQILYTNKKVVGENF